MLWFLLLFNLELAIGFLLEPTNQNGVNVPSENYITHSKYFQEQKLIKQTIERLRGDMIQLNHDDENSLALLTSQLQQRLTDLQKQINNNPQQHNNSECQQRYNEIEENYTKLENKYNSLLVDNQNHYHMLMETRNITSELKRDISNLKDLKNIQPIQDLQSLQQEVQFIKTETQKLSFNERARNQDFLALYNKTTIAEIQTQHRFNQIETNIRFATSNISRKIDDLESNHNDDLSIVRQQLANASERIALTSCISAEGSKLAKTILKFDDIRFQVGMRNISSFKASGKFICEQEGLYHISVFVSSNTNGAYYGIYKNENHISSLFNSHEGGGDVTTTGSAVLELQVGDSAYIKLVGNMFVFGRKFSCITIAKIK